LHWKSLAEERKIYLNDMPHIKTKVLGDRGKEWGGGGGGMTFEVHEIPEDRLPDN